MSNNAIRPLLEVTLNGSQAVVDHYSRLLLAVFELTYGSRVNIHTSCQVSPLGLPRTEILLTWKESKP